jgi:hypothetical protein
MFTHSTFRVVPARAIVLLVSLAAAGCGGDSGTNPVPEAVAVATVEVTAPADALPIGGTAQLTATTRDAVGNVLSGRAIEWSSENLTVARVSTSGQVEALTPGTTRITARSEGRTGSASITVVVPVQFSFPLVGDLNRDFFYTNYVDLDAGPGTRDYQCGSKTYNGHTGVDIVLPSFHRMDQGVLIVAAAPGRVTHVADGLPDRNTQWVGGGFGNHVVITHDNGYQSIYAHMKRGSVRPTVGDQVQTGTPLGEVGSSGFSDMPHLHFEVRSIRGIVEAFAGSCGPGFSHWKEAHPYQDAFRVIAAELSSEMLTTDNIKGPPPVPTSVRAGERINLWVHLHNVRPGMASRWELISPSGAVSGSFTRNHDAFYSMSWWWAWFSPTQPGTWRFDHYHDGVLVAQRSFAVTASGAHAATGAPADGTPAEAASGSGGGMTWTHPH